MTRGIDRSSAHYRDSWDKKPTLWELEHTVPYGPQPRKLRTPFVTQRLYANDELRLKMKVRSYARP